jgi:hypothetical protein
MRRKPPRPSPALVLAFLAVLIALGGTTFAAVPRATKTASSKPNIKTVRQSFTVSNSEARQSIARCPSGYEVLGGGYVSSGVYTLINIAAPLRANAAYEVGAVEPPVNIVAGVRNETATIQLVAYCAPERQPVVFG